LGFFMKRGENSRPRLRELPELKSYVREETRATVLVENPPYSKKSTPKWGGSKDSKYNRKGEKKGRKRRENGG